MRERLAARLSEIKDVVTLGTFHSFCLEFLRVHIHLTDLPKEFRVAAPLEIDSLASRLWIDKKANQRQETLEEISRWKSTKLEGEAPADVKLLNLALREEGWLDFDDLLCVTLKLLQTNENVRGETQRKYPFVFVDEYQDINGIQQALLKILTIRDSNQVLLTAIGDPNQAIYGFRGADVRFFESFQNDFSGATILYLQDNYRSSPNLLKASSQVISKENTFSVPELTAQIFVEGRLTVHASATDKAEAEFVVHQIEKLVGGTSLFSQDSRRVDSEDDAQHSFKEIAVLYRLNVQGKILEEAFVRSGIPYQLAEGPLLSQPGVLEILVNLKSLIKKSPDTSMEKILERFIESPSGKDWLSADTKRKEIFAKLKRCALFSKSATHFFDRLSLQRSEDSLENRVEKVSLMTLHASKGLEFPVVFIVGCEENLLPLNLNGLSSDPQEERRLFYVGMTRAKKRLYLLHAHHRRIFGQLLENKPSVFLFDIEEQLKAYEKMLYKSSSKNKREQQQLTLFNDD